MRKGSQFAFVIRWSWITKANCKPFLTASFCHFFLILLSWLWDHVQIQQHKNKVRLVARCAVEWLGGSVGASSFGWFLGGFCWLRIISDGFRLFAILVIIPISHNTEKLTLYYNHGRMWFTEIITFFHSKWKKQSKKETARKGLLLPCRLAVWK